MPPNQNKNSQNPYDFITTPGQAPVSGFSPNKKQRIILIILGAITVIILIIVVVSFFNKAGQAQNQKLIELAQTQTEIVRVSAIGAGKATSLETKSLAINTQLSVESAKQTTKQALKNRKAKAPDKVLNSGKNTKSDTLLADATANNRFDQTFTELIQTKLASYQKQAKSVYDSSTPAEQKTFQTAFSGMNFLLPKSASQPE